MCKKILIVVLVFASLMFSGCSMSSASKSDVVRIHIRANSNEGIDQDVKLIVRDNIIDYITPLIASCNSSNEVKSVLGDNLNNIKLVASDTLTRCGFEYGCSVGLRNEFFPSRDYDGVTFGADYYDALIVELGTGKGDNWWCVAYPPLCFVGEDIEGDNVKYKSKLLELINGFWGGAK
ncbi:MAG: hypothetical protein E7356_03250 [Clostridiales bacterium]|nr:hypothetical protein [Clostridiales bacterium]